MTSDPFGNTNRDFKPTGSARNTFYWPDNLKEKILFGVYLAIFIIMIILLSGRMKCCFSQRWKALNVFDRPGRYALTTQNIPVLASLLKVTAGIEQVGEA
jgi:hypothetical protein